MRSVAVLALGLLSVGCLRWKTDVVVMPDGSGKVTVAVSFDEAVAKMPASDLRTLSSGATGFVAFTKPVVTTEGGWKTITFTGYFDDVNTVRLPQHCSARPLSWTKSGDGWALECADSVVPGDLGDLRRGGDLSDERRKSLEDRWPVLYGAAFSRRVILPGPVTSNDGVDKKDGCTATDAVDASKVKTLDDALKSGVLRHTRRKVVCGASILTEDEIAAFRKELDAAKAAWPKLQQELGADAPSVEASLKVRAPKAKEERKRLVCLEFQDRTEFGRGRMGAGSAETVSAYLVRSEQFRVLDRGAEKDDPAKAGKALGADVVVYGSIVNFGMRAVRTSDSKKYVAEVTIDWRAVDVATGEIIYADKSVGSAEQEGGSYDETLPGRAIRAAVVKKIDDLIDGIEKKR